MEKKKFHRTARSTDREKKKQKASSKQEKQMIATDYITNVLDVQTQTNQLQMPLKTEVEAYR